MARRLGEFGYLVPSGRAALEWAYIDFERFSTFDEYVAQCRKVNTGNAVRDALKAERKGYYSKFFNPRRFVTDIVAVNTSTQDRQGGRCRPHYFLPVEKRGGLPTPLETGDPTLPGILVDAPLGVFREKPGHRQGDVVVDEELLAYCMLRRCSEFVYYSTFLGHWDYLKDGVTYKMHMDLVQAILNFRNVTADDQGGDRSLDGARYLFYARYYTVSKGLQMWKRRMLFRPGHFEFDYPKPRVAPAAPSPLVTLSAFDARIDADYAAAGFAPGPEEGRISLVLQGGREEPPSGEGCFNLFHGFAQPEAWKAVKGVLIGSSLADQHHRLFTEALVDICRELAPHADIFAGKSENDGATPSAAARDFGDWLLRRSAQATLPGSSPASLTARALATVVSGNAHRAMALDLLLQQVAPEQAIADIVGIGGGIGLMIFFLAAGRKIDRPRNIGLVEYAVHFHDQIRELYRSLEVRDGQRVSLSLAGALSEASLPANATDLVVFAAEIWRIAESEWAAVFRNAWDSLRSGGLLVINPVVRSDSDTADRHDRSFPHPTRSQVIQLMTFDQSPRLYRAASLWGAARIR